MGISCPCSKGSGDGETGIDFEEIEEDENYISMDNFFNKIPKPILDEMNSEKASTIATQAGREGAAAYYNTSYEDLYEIKYNRTYRDTCFYIITMETG